MLNRATYLPDSLLNAGAKWPREEPIAALPNGTATLQVTCRDTVPKPARISRRVREPFLQRAQEPLDVRLDIFGRRLAIASWYRLLDAHRFVRAACRVQAGGNARSARSNT